MLTQGNFRAPVIRSLLVITVIIVIAIPQLNCQNSQSQSKTELEQLLIATLWFQTSAEARACYYQAFRYAKEKLDEIVESKEQAQNLAVIVDLDETVLDNSPYFAELIKRDIMYPHLWNEWVNLSNAKVTPGAREFLHYAAHQKNINIFYITNRSEKTRYETLKNLQRLKFPQATDEHLLMRIKDSDKELRRQIVENDYEVVMLLGDNLNDFSSIFRDKSAEKRCALVDSLQGQFGQEYMILPNPIYGDWLDSIFNFTNNMSPDEKYQKMIRALKSFDQTNN